MSAHRISELERRQANIIRPGTITAADYATARVQVQLGQNVTTWLPWVAGRAGGNRTWNPPEVGEQVLVLSPGGDYACGFVIPGIFQSSFPANGNSANLWREDFSDGASIQYDRSAHVLTANIPGGGGIHLTVGGCTMQLSSTGLTLTGGDIVADGISLKQHTHPGVQTGSGNTGQPVG